MRLPLSSSNGQFPYMSAKITLAINQSSGYVDHIDQVDKNNKFHYRFRGCEKDLIVVKSNARKKDWHFRHVIETSCSGAYDKALHDYAVQVILDNTSMIIEKYLRMEYSSPKKEQWIGAVRSDVKVVHNAEEIHIEIVVTHDMDENKLEYYRSEHIKCIRIDLSNPGLRKADTATIKEAILEDYTNKELFNWNETFTVPARPAAPKSWLDFAIPVLVFLALIFFVRNMIVNVRKRMSI